MLGSANMYRTARGYLIFFALIIVVIQNAGAISFATEYKICINGQQIGHLKRSISREGHTSIEIEFMPVSEEQGSIEEDLMELLVSNQTISLQTIFHHYQSVLSLASPASASPIQNNKISITLMESASHPISISYYLSGKTASYSLAGQAENTQFVIGGTNQVYGFNPGQGFYVKDLIHMTQEEDEGVDQMTSIHNEYIESVDSLVTASLKDTHNEDVTGSFFLFGQNFEKLLTTLAEGQDPNSGLLNLYSIFLVLIVSPEQSNFKLQITGYGQEVIYDSGSNIFIQQDPADDPSPTGVITTYQINSNGIITSIAIRDGKGEVTFSSEQITI